jgi:hypothetical protein
VLRNDVTSLMPYASVCHEKPPLSRCRNSRSRRPRPSLFCVMLSWDLSPLGLEGAGKPSAYSRQRRRATVV